MAKIKHKPHIEEMIGAHSKDGTVERRKVFRDYDGNVTRVGRLEAYIPHSRNYKANPIYFRERANMTAFGNASHLAQEFIDSMRNKTPLPPEKHGIHNRVWSEIGAQITFAPAAK